MTGNSCVPMRSITGKAPSPRPFLTASCRKTAGTGVWRHRASATTTTLRRVSSPIPPKSIRQRRTTAADLSATTSETLTRACRFSAAALPGETPWAAESWSEPAGDRHRSMQEVPIPIPSRTTKDALPSLTSTETACQTRSGKVLAGNCITG